REISSSLCLVVWVARAAAWAAAKPSARCCCIAWTRARSSGEYSLSPPAERVGCSSPYRRSQARNNSGLTPERRLSSPIRSSPAVSTNQNIEHLDRSLTRAAEGDNVTDLYGIYTGGGRK